MRIIFEAIAWLSFINDILIIKIKSQVEKWDRDWFGENRARCLRWSPGELVIPIKSFKSSEEGEIYWIRRKLNERAYEGP